MIPRRVGARAGEHRPERPGQGDRVEAVVAGDVAVAVLLRQAWACRSSTRPLGQPAVLRRPGRTAGPGGRAARRLDGRRWAGGLDRLSVEGGARGRDHHADPPRRPAGRHPGAAAGAQGRARPRCARSCPSPTSAPAKRVLVRAIKTGKAPVAPSCTPLVLPRSGRRRATAEAGGDPDAARQSRLGLEPQTRSRYLGVDDIRPLRMLLDVARDEEGRRSLASPAAHGRRRSPEAALASAEPTPALQGRRHHRVRQRPLRRAARILG